MLSSEGFPWSLRNSDEKEEQVCAERELTICQALYILIQLSITV